MHYACVYMCMDVYIYIYVLFIFKSYGITGKNFSSENMQGLKDSFSPGHLVGSASNGAEISWKLQWMEWKLPKVSQQGERHGQESKRNFLWNAIINLALCMWFKMILMHFLRNMFCFLGASVHFALTCNCQFCGKKKSVNLSHHLPSCFIHSLYVKIFYIFLINE